MLADETGPLRRAIRCALRKHVSLVVPTAVIAEATTGDHRRDANVNRTLKSAALVDLNAAVARSAAALRHAHRRAGAGTIDAIVVATADLVPGSHVLTGDPADLRRLASVNGHTHVVPLTLASAVLGGDG